MKMKRNLILISLLAVLPAVAQAQDYTFTTNTDNTITLTWYTGTGGDVVVPDTINGRRVTALGLHTDAPGFGPYGVFESCYGATSVTLPNSITSLGTRAFYQCFNLNSVTLPNGITNIGDSTFYYCFKLTNVTIPPGVVSIDAGAFNHCKTLQNLVLPNSLRSIGDTAFYYCALTNVTIPNGVTAIAGNLFYDCHALTSVTLGNQVTSIGDSAFESCGSLGKVYFKGNAPSVVGSSVFDWDSGITVYYMPGTSGWDVQFDGFPTAAWMLPNPMILDFEPNFGVKTNRFGFTISWATNLAVVVETCTNLFNPPWRAVQTNTLTSGAAYFSDAQWTNYPARFYRLRAP
jgi:hypothetical protein